MTALQQALPGWYPEPSGAPGLCYFDGTDWTAYHAAPAVPMPISAAERSDRFDMVVAEQVSAGWRVESRTMYQATFVCGSQPNHVVWCLLTLFSCGLLAFAWLIAAATQRERRMTLLIDPYGVIHS